LYLARVSGNEEVERATLVYKVEDQFIVRVKLPLSSSRFELVLYVSTKMVPHILKEHPLKYVLVSSDVCQNLLASLKHSLAPKFGYAIMPPTAQLYRTTIISPSTYRIHPQQVYFLVHVAGEEASSRIASDANSASQTSKLFRDRLQRLEKTTPGNSGSRPASKLRKSVKTTNTVNWAADFHEALGKSIEPHCQDSEGAMHFDLCVSNKYVLKLKQRVDFPELFECLLTITEADVRNYIALFLRRPKASPSEYFPEKLAEWKICPNETFPLGF